MSNPISSPEPDPTTPREPFPAIGIVLLVGFVAAVAIALWHPWTKPKVIAAPPAVSGQP